MEKMVSTLVFLIVNRNAIFLNGNVGIGTTTPDATPDAKLKVTGDVGGVGIKATGDICTDQGGGVCLSSGGGGGGALIVASGSSTGTPSTTLALPAGTWTVIAWMWNRGGAVPATALIIDGTTVASFPSMGDPTGTDTGTLMGFKTGVTGDRTITISTTGITSGFVGVFSFAIRTGSGGGGNSGVIWEVSIPQGAGWRCADVPEEQCIGQGCFLKMKTLYTDGFYWSYSGTLDYSPSTRTATFSSEADASRIWLFTLNDDIGGQNYWAHPSLLWLVDCRVDSGGVCIAGTQDNIHLCSLTYNLEAFLLDYNLL